MGFLKEDDVGRVVGSDNFDEVLLVVNTIQHKVVVFRLFVITAFGLGAGIMISQFGCQASSL